MREPSMRMNSDTVEQKERQPKNETEESECTSAPIGMKSEKKETFKYQPMI